MTSPRQSVRWAVRVTTSAILGLTRPVIAATGIAAFMTMVQGHHGPLYGWARELVALGGLILGVRHPEWMFE